jgi:hypothetical protein
MKDDLVPLEAAMASTIASGQGSVQEKTYLEASNTAQRALSAELSIFEELMVPVDFKREIPAEFANLPKLSGRAEVAMVFKKADGSQYDVDGKLYDQVDIRVRVRVRVMLGFLPLNSCLLLSYISGVLLAFKGC